MPYGGTKAWEVSWSSESHQSHQMIRINPNLIKKKDVLIRILTRLRPFTDAVYLTFLQGLFHNCLISKQLQNR